MAWLQCEDWADSEITKLETHVRMCSHPTSNLCKSRNYWVSNHTSNFSKIGQSDPEIRRWGEGCTCRGAHVQRCPTPLMTCGKHVLNDPPSHIPNLNTIGQADSEIQKYGLHVRTCRDTPPMTCVEHLVHDPQLTHQNWTQSAEPFLRYRSAVCSCARAEIPHRWLVLTLARTGGGLVQPPPPEVFRG